MTRSHRKSRVFAGRIFGKVTLWANNVCHVWSEESEPLPWRKGYCDAGPGDENQGHSGLAQNHGNSLLVAGGSMDQREGQPVYVPVPDE